MLGLPSPFPPSRRHGAGRSIFLAALLSERAETATSCARSRGHCRIDGDNVQPHARDLWPAGEALPPLSKRRSSNASLNDELPVDAFAGIKIKNGGL
jgi:hypothetical protein